MSRLFIVPLFVVYLVSSCTKKDNQSFTTPVPVQVPPVIAGSAKTYLALGDSYTIGQSVKEEERFPVQTAAQLLSDTIKIAPPEIIARTGWTTGNLLSSLNTVPPAFNQYDIVSLLIGVNNQYQHLSQSKYREEFTMLLNKSIAFAGNKKNRVFVLSIPDYSVTPYATGSNQAMIAAEIDAFNSINKEITLASGCNYIDITPSTRQAADDRSLIATDGLHPSGKEYKKWADLLAPAVKLSFR